jgi:Zinc knuckle
MTMRQEDKRVSEYNTMFLNLARYAPYIRGDPYHYRRHYIDGLRPRIAAVVDNPLMQDLRELMSYAETVETHHKRDVEFQQSRNVRPKVSKNLPPSRSTSKTSGLTPTRPTEDRSRGKGWCRNCNLPHEESQCRYLTRACFQCGATDHWRNECPQL